jgi:hypothetical protein
MLRDLLTQKYLQKKPVTDFRYPRVCRFRKTKQATQFRSPGPPSTNFKKTVSNVFYYLQNVKIGEKSF